MKLIDKVIDWLDERTGLKAPLLKVLTHPVPPGAKWYYVFGTAVLTAFIVQLITGVALTTAYVPSAGEAYDTVRYITTSLSFGSLVRGMHYFGASAMVLFAVIHMIQVYLFGSYKYPRELNWLTGVALLFFTLAMGFTGQVLRWDQTSVWTVAVGAEQAMRAPFVGKLIAQILISGGTIGSATLNHFFALHVFIFPGIVIGAIGLHLYLVLRNGISEPPVEGEPVDPKTYKEKYESMLQRVGRPFWPDAAWRDIVFSSLVVLGILGLAFFVGPPAIEKPPDPSIVNAQPRPDWYLIWYFALLALLPHAAEDYIIILFPVIVGLSLVAVPFASNKGERSLKRRPWAVAIVICALAAILALTVEGFKEPWTPSFNAKPLTAEIVNSQDPAIQRGAKVFDDKGCLYCHSISGHGGQRGPDLSDVANRLTKDDMIVRIVNGGYNMPAYAGNIKPEELQDLTTFLLSRKTEAPIKIELSLDEIKRVRDIATDGISEIQLGQLALTNSESAQVKEFATKMIKEHTVANEDLQIAASAAALKLPTEVSHEQKHLIETLAALKGVPFDQKYTEVVLHAHQVAMTAIDSEAKEGSGALKNWAQQTLVTIKRHHHLATQLVGR